MNDALVLGGGGVAGIAWLTGLLAGLADTGHDVRHAGLLVGTSAGSAVAAQLGSGLSLDDLYARQVDPDQQAAEIDPEVDLDGLVVRFTSAISPGATPAEVRQAIGRLALDADTVPEEARRAVIVSRLPAHEWPSQEIRVAAVHAETGDLEVFDRSSGVDLVDAVAASCAVPGVWPPATVGGQRYIDGGIRSATNVDLAAGASRVLVLAPTGEEDLFPAEVPFADAVAGLRAAGATVTVVIPDAASVEAIGANPLDPSTRGPAAVAGRAQGRALRLASGADSAS